LHADKLSVSGRDGLGKFVFVHPINTHRAFTFFEVSEVACNCDELRLRVFLIAIPAAIT
jgi:hypothetical protein